MFEFFLLSAVIVAGVSGGLTALISIWNKGLASPRFHVNPELEAPEPRRMVMGSPYQPALEAPRKPIDPSIRAELDETPEWWDGKFHAALKASGAVVVARELGDIIEEHTAAGDRILYHQDDREALAGCECGECVAVMKSSGPVGSDLDLRIYAYEEEED